jgi:lipoate-protein ligase B
LRVPDVLLFTEHLPVFTLGRRGNAQNLLVSPSFLEKRGIRCEHTDRGGDVTYHGPGQLVGYPVLRVHGGSRRVRQYVEALEDVLLRALRQFGVHGERVPGQPGVWAGGGKIAFIGLAVEREVCFHGFALNVSPDLTPFSWMNPCGLLDTPVTSMKTLLGTPPSIREVIRALTAAFADRLGYRHRQVSPRALGVP